MSKPVVLNHFGLSGGKDSGRLAQWALYESGYPRESLVFSACDTGNENEYTYAYLFWLADHLGIPHPLDHAAAWLLRSGAKKEAVS